ncbi:helix-turn-helix domain-containing protein [Clostridium diolis]|uniref:helix-turn-helix domain-containing protein n=1 Tax=Clostridium diolis TaxID=223919 RepID=UPI003AF5994C
MLRIDVKKIAIAQAKACLSISEISERTKLGKSTISKILNGINNPSTKSLGLIAKALSVKIEDLLTDDK